MFGSDLRICDIFLGERFDYESRERISLLQPPSKNSKSPVLLLQDAPFVRSSPLAGSASRFGDDHGTMQDNNCRPQGSPVREGSKERVCEYTFIRHFYVGIFGRPYHS